jgi:hypothetical protein
VDDHPKILTPDHIDVAGLDEFLQATTAPGEVDSHLVNARLGELSALLQSRHSRLGSRLPPEFRWVSVLGAEEAATMLAEFLKDTAFVKKNLQLAMHGKPQGVCPRHSPSSLSPSPSFLDAFSPLQSHGVGSFMSRCLC